MTMPGIDRAQAVRERASSISTAQLALLASKDHESTFYDQLDRLMAAASALEPSSRPSVGGAFRPLLFGYTGAGNVGADVRVREMIRQLRVVFGRAGFEPGLVVMGDVREDPILDSCEPVVLNQHLCDFLPQWLPRFDGVIACEGSMFTSTFSDLLSAVFAAVIGYAARSGQLAIAYGADAGRMNDRLRAFVARTCSAGLVLCRSPQTQGQLHALGIETKLGADSAWTYDGTADESTRARQALVEAGWDGRMPIAAVCPVNPFWWPVTIDVARARAMQRTGQHADSHYRGLFFHDVSSGSAEALDRYLDALAFAVQHARRRGYFAIVIGMERLDADVCVRLAEKSGAVPPSFVSGSCSSAEIVALLRTASMVVTSRFHAAVLAIGALIPTIGVSFDSRIENLFTEGSLDAWFLSCSSDDLPSRLTALIDAVAGSDVEPLQRALVRQQIVRLGLMGRDVAREVSSVYPDLPSSGLPDSWAAHLPPLSKRIDALLTA